jgi:hypothetical protein
MRALHQFILATASGTNAEHGGGPKPLSEQGRVAR